MNREQIARVAHEVNRAYCASLGDSTQPDWDQAPEWQQASALADVALHLANPAATPEQSHESWLAQKLAEGWSCGEVKDANAKRHPCCRPYAELSQEQKSRGFLFRAVVHAVAAITPPVPAKPAALATAVTANGLVPVVYVGHRAQHIDGTYGSHMRFPRGVAVPCPADLAGKLLRHADVFQATALQPGLAGMPVAMAQAPVPLHEEEDPQEQGLRDTIAFMDKGALGAFAKTHFKVDLDQRKGVDKLRREVTGLFDRFGVA
ncbi:RyR domain-containing protein [Chitiniphilus eburneus]|uniref:RyR domain-containing protein n=1 Tax=Chitiniphilus eburneus TaxID=2571148 RepID=UPI001B7F8C6C|nr:RyR domain-containing protein [Chitiniphilus eburneus]